MNADFIHMDTDEKYLGDEFFVKMAGERGPDWYIEHMESKENVVSVGPASGNRRIGEQPPVDGWVTFYDPDLLEAGEPFKHGDIPFRDYRKTAAPWFAFPDKPAGEKHPVWKWQNPDEDPHESLTLQPSIGLHGSAMHCYIRDGEIDWL